jgi:hypothetical protein
MAWPSLQTSPGVGMQVFVEQSQVPIAVHVQLLHPSPAGVFSPGLQAAPASTAGRHAFLVQAQCPLEQPHVLHPSLDGLVSPSIAHAAPGLPT